MSTYPHHPAADLFPLLTGDQLSGLADDIAANGLHEPVWLYDDPDLGRVLLDGRNRVAACEIAGVPVTTRVYTGDDPIGFSLATNSRRRHLTTGQKASVAVASLPLFEAEAARRVGGRPRKDDAKPGADLPQVRAHRARDRAAKATGASGRAVAQYKRLIEVAQDLAEKVHAGTMALDRADRTIRDREATTRRVAEAKREAATAGQVATVDIRHGDFRDVLDGLTNIDAIITDPPYGAEHLHLLDDLAAWADKVLTPDGVLAVLMGQMYLPEVYRRLEGHRTYRWTCAYLTPGNGYVSHPRRMQSNWKPLILYGGGPRLADVIRSEGSDAAAKSHHIWGQDYAAFHTLIERLTLQGQTVADPFMGSGTTLLAAHALGRHTIGADTEQEHVDTARKRLAP